MNNVLATMCYVDNGDSFLMLKRTKKENDIHEGLTISVGGKFEVGESPEAYVFTAQNYTGTLTKDCDEGDLVWVKKSEIQNINTWEGDYIFLDWLVKEKPFFSAKFNYKNKEFIDYEVTFYE